jgi:hypothetical protein
MFPLAIILGIAVFAEDRRGARVCTAHSRSLVSPWRPITAR